MQRKHDRGLSGDSPGAREPYSLHDVASLFGSGMSVGASPVQRKATDTAGPEDSDRLAPSEIAGRGVAGAGAGAPLPHLTQIQASFGHHDVSGVRSHQGAGASDAARALGAEAYAFDDSVAFGSSPDLHTAAHEAAHVVQQRGGVQLKGGVDEPGDAYERHADAVADAVVAGRSAAPLLDQAADHGGHQRGAVHRTPAVPPAAPTVTGAGAAPQIAPAKAGINKTGFIDNSEGTKIRTGPREAGGQMVQDEPLPPATRVFVSGTHPTAPDWWYVTATLRDKTMVRGYVQGTRVNVDVPEPLAELRQLDGGETAEALAKEKFGPAVTDGHDLRYYENVLLYVNQGRAGIRGTYQDPGILGGGSNNIQLLAGHRIWLVSPEYAKALQSVVPSGSFTGGAVAEARRFARHLEDILQSVSESRNHFGEVAGEVAQAIRDNLPEIIGVTALFLAAEAGSMFLAAAPTGVSQAAAAVIQLALAAFGASGMVQAGIAALKHGSAWLTIAWTAQGKPERIAEASKEFLRMLIAVAMATLSYLGAKGNYGNALKIARTMPTDGLPAFATAGSTGRGAAHAGAGVAVGPGVGGFGIAGAQMVKHESEGGDSDSAKPAEGDKASAPKHDGEPASQTPSSNVAEPYGPAKLTGPSGKPDPRATPTGRRATPSPADKDPANIRALAQENESADILSKQGYRVEQNPNVPGRKNPDFRVEGEIFDNYAPTTSSPRSIWTTIQQKVLDEQARRIILKLSSSGVDLAKLKAQLDQWPIENLEQILIIKGSSVIRFWP